MIPEKIVKTAPLASLMALASFYFPNNYVVVGLAIVVGMLFEYPLWIITQYILFIYSDATLVLQIGMLTTPAYVYLKMGKTWQDMDRIVKIMGNPIKELPYALKMVAILEVTIGLLVLGLSNFGIVDLGVGKITPIIALTTLTAAVCEEMFFRGLLYNTLGLWESSIIFGLMHAPQGSITLVFGAIIGGVFLGKAYEVRKTLLSPILIHFTVNLLSLIVATQTST